MLSDARGAQPAIATGRLAAAECHGVHERAAQARAAASEAIERYVILLEQSQRRANVTAHILLATEATREMFRESLERYAQLMKALGTPPERMLRLVKDAVTEHVPHPEREKETHALLENAVTWCIEAYYGAPPAA